MTVLIGFISGIVLCTIVFLFIIKNKEKKLIKGLEISEKYLNIIWFNFILGVATVIYYLVSVGLAKKEYNNFILPLLLFLIWAVVNIVYNKISNYGMKTEEKSMCYIITMIFVIAVGLVLRVKYNEKEGIALAGSTFAIMVSTYIPISLFFSNGKEDITKFIEQVKNGFRLKICIISVIVNTAIFVPAFALRFLEYIVNSMMRFLIGLLFAIVIFFVAAIVYRIFIASRTSPDDNNSNK